MICPAASNDGKNALLHELAKGLNTFEENTILSFGGSARIEIFLGCSGHRFVLHLKKKDVVEHFSEQEEQILTIMTSITSGLIFMKYIF